MTKKHSVTSLKEKQNNLEGVTTAYAPGREEDHRIKEIKEVVADLYHRALLLTESEDPASDDFANKVDGISETIDELKRTHRDYQRHIFYQIIAEGIRVMHRQGLCLESVKHNDIIFRVDEDGGISSNYDDAQVPF